jgi:hypothetical protein
VGGSRARSRLSAEDHRRCSMTKALSGPPRGCPPPLSATITPHMGRASDGGSEGMASRNSPDVNGGRAFPRGLRDGRKRWTNGLPGATKRLGAMMALRGLSGNQSGCARIPMMARSKIAPLQRPNTLMQLSRSSVLELRLATRGRAIGTSATCQESAWSSVLGGGADVRLTSRATDRDPLRSFGALGCLIRTAWTKHWGMGDIAGILAQLR